METTVIKCDCCGKITEDIYAEIGWITFSNSKNVTVSGGRNKEGNSDTFRYINNIEHNIHICSIECLLKFLYLTKGNFNRSNNETLEDRLKSIDSDKRRNQILDILKKVQLIINMDKTSFSKSGIIFQTDSST